MKPEYGTLEECVAEIRRLTEENHLLREASLTFGGLAERLRMRLERECEAPASRLADQPDRGRPNPSG